MQTMKILLLLALTCGFCLAVEFEPCPHALKGESCNMTCHVPDFSKTILILCNGVTRGSCSTFLGCGSNVIQEGGNKAHLKISSLSYTSDSCEWSCTYGTNSSSPLNVTIYSGISNLNLTSEINADGVKLTAIADCLYPYDPIVDVQYSIELDGQYASLSQQVDLQSSTTPGGCSDAIERRVTATYDVSAKHAELKGKSVFFRMKFSQYPSGEFNFTNTKGSFFFEGCKYSDAELFLGGFSCFLIVFGITSIIMLIFLLCQMLPKIFDDKKTNKIIIIVVFNSLALIFGFALGFGLKECEKRDLGLGLGLGFGFILAIALFLTLYIYHKQCGSKKGVSRRAMEYISCTQSGQ